MNNSRDFDLDCIRRRFSGLLSGFAKAVPAESIVTYGYTPAADSSQCPFIIKPSSHERVAIEAHRSDWL